MHIFRTRLYNITRLMCCLAIALSPIASKSFAGETKPTAIHVYPVEVKLTTQRDRQSVIVQAVYPDGITRDVTSQAKFTLSNPDFAGLDKNTLHPKADGRTTLKVLYGDLGTDVPLEVQQASVDRPISFKLDVMPIFLKTGCNTGSCHGAARGKDGFRLSLFGYDPDGDYFRLTRQISGRRINLAMPNESLLLEKTIGKVPHTGGTRFKENSDPYNTLLRWLEAGAPKDSGEVPRVEAIEIYPKEAVLDGPGAAQRLSVRARYSDGTDRDITSRAKFTSNNSDSAKVAEDGVVTAGKRGEAFITARFDTHTIGTHFIILPKGLQFKWKEIAEHNYIDKLMNEKFLKLRIIPSDVCSDEIFLRRATLDITGKLPTAEKYQSFIKDNDPKKRDKLVDELLSRKEFVEIWVMKWAELLQIRTSRQVSYKAMLRYYNWLQERIANNIPMDQMVQELLGSSGGTFSNAATNYYQNETNALKISENVAQVFMGMRIQCAQCHNHPFDRWTMDDYYSFGAFFSQIGRKRGEDPRETIVYNNRSGQVKHPVGGRTMAPKFLGGEVPDVQGKDRRIVMAQWLASKDNPYFAKNLSNIVWAHFFGRGIIDEVDDVRVTNPAVNPVLLDELARHFAEYKYDFKKLVRDICTSRTYQLATQTNETNENDTRNFSHASLRRLRAEILLDAISQVTETKNKFRGLPLGARAVQIADGKTTNYFLTTFGRAKRESVCACEVKMEPNLSQVLHLLNGNTLHSNIQRGKFIQRRVAEGKKSPEIITELYIRCLTRKPTQKEMSALSAIIDPEKNQRQVLEDVFWSLLNSREFLFIH